MELWIRSQQKEMLFKVNSSLIIRHNDDVTNGVYFIECDKQKIAMYRTRERALEVLDEIQSKLTLDCSINGNYQEMDLQIKARLVESQYGEIYEMPEE